MQTCKENGLYESLLCGYNGKEESRRRAVPTHIGEATDGGEEKIVFESIGNAGTRTMLTQGAPSMQHTPTAQITMPTWSALQGGKDAPSSPRDSVHLSSDVSDKSEGGQGASHASWIASALNPRATTGSTRNNAGPAQNGNGGTTGSQVGSGRETSPHPPVRIPDFGNRPTPQQLSAQLEAASKKYGIPENILKAIAWKESTYGKHLHGADGHGRGVMQIDNRWHRFARTPAAMNSAANIDYSARQLLYWKSRGGSWERAVGHYNGGNQPNMGYSNRVMQYTRSQPWKSIGG